MYDMSTWEHVLSSFATFFKGDFWHMAFGGLFKGAFSAVRSAFSLLLAFLTAAVPALDRADDLVRGCFPFTAASPAEMCEYTAEADGLIEDADFYVSPDGDDGADGSFEAPFRTPERARDAARALDRTGRDGITVALTAGEYRVDGLTFASEDGGTETCPVVWRAYGDGEVVFNGGVSLSPALFEKATDPGVLARLSDAAKNRVLAADLSALGVTAEEYGKIYAIGTYHNAAMYSDGGTGPVYSELFVNDTRCSLARYPDEGFVKTGEVTAVNDGRFLADGSANPAWGTVADPTGETFRADEETAAHIARWQTFDDVWMMGFWKYDWADGSTPVGAYDPGTRELTMRYASFYGAKEGAPYYFFNVLEELDAPGEWYLDRENGVIYLYPPEDFADARIDLSLTTRTLLTANNISYFTLRGITFKGTRGNAIAVNGEHNTVENCLVKNVSGSAMLLSGTDNAALCNEITRTGRGGISLTGGDAASLTPGNNRAVNNLIHDWSEIYRTYQPAVSLYGVGNVCEHNEICNSPHEAITYSGNNHRIAYNRIHDVCLISSDAGAIYAGRSWTSYGNEIIYNCIYDLGSGDFTPCGIYMDDALSGQKIFGNLLVNIPGFALHLGGGRDLDVRNNIILSGGQRGISYDQRAIDGANGGWFAEHSSETGNMWTQLRSSPWQSETWREAFPQMAAFSDDFSDQDNPGFVPNPAGSVVADNLFVTGRRTVGEIAEKARQFSEFRGNALFRKGQMTSLFENPADGDYRIRPDAPIFTIAPDFEPLPVELMGRMNPD